MPSPLCLDALNTPMTTNDGCVYRSEASHRKDDASLDFIQWYNGDERLEIDLTFKIIDFDAYHIPSTADSYFHENQHHTIGMQIGGCQGKHYWIRLSKNNASDDYPLSWAFWNGFTSQQFGWKSISPANIESDVYYTLNVVIVRVNDTSLYFNISFNHILYHSRYITTNSYNDDNPLNIMRNGYSGFIKLSTQYAAAEFKSLYVSGTPVMDSIELCTSAPTPIPTSDPTRAPTEDPTYYPTIYPFKYPTKRPSEIPSTSPILYAIDVIIAYRLNMTIILSSHPSANITQEITRIINDTFYKIFADSEPQCLDRYRFQPVVAMDNNVTIIKGFIDVCESHTQQKLYIALEEDVKGDILNLNVSMDITIIKSQSAKDRNKLNAKSDNTPDIVIIIVTIGCLLCAIAVIIIGYKSKQRSAKRECQSDVKNLEGAIEMNETVSPSTNAHATLDSCSTNTQQFENIDMTSGDVFAFNRKASNESLFDGHLDLDRKHAETPMTPKTRTPHNPTTGGNV